MNRSDFLRILAIAAASGLSLDSLAFARHHYRADIDNIDRGLFRRQRFTGERRLINPEIDGGGEPCAGTKISTSPGTTVSVPSMISWPARRTRALGAAMRSSTAMARLTRNYLGGNRPEVHRGEREQAVRSETCVAGVGFCGVAGHGKRSGSCEISPHLHQGPRSLNYLRAL